MGEGVAQLMGMDPPYPGPPPPSLQQSGNPEVQVFNAYPEQLAPAHGGVDQEPDERLVPPVLEARAGTVGQQLLEFLLPQHRHRLLGDLGMGHPGHGVGFDLPSSTRYLKNCCKARKRLEAVDGFQRASTSPM